MAFLSKVSRIAELANAATNLATTLDTQLNQGIAQVTTGLRDNIGMCFVDGDSLDELSFAGSSSVSEVSSNIQHYMNPLENYASYVPLWTMACLTPEQFNNPASYRGNPGALKNIIFSSAGRYDSQRARTDSGTPEYFIDNFEMTSHLAAGPRQGNTTAIKFSWEIYEPYSMGKLLESMQVAAIQAGYTNYMDNAPYLLRLDIRGYDEAGNTLELSERLTKYFVCKFKKVEFDVNETGSKYEIEAIPYNHLGFGALINKTFTDINLEGGTVREVLVTGRRSLVKNLNDKQQALVRERRQDIADEYSIWFPKSALDNPPAPRSSTFLDVAQFLINDDPSTLLPGFDPIPQSEYGGNSIGLSSLDFDIKSGGTYPHSQEGDVYENGVLNRGSVRLSPTARTLSFVQGQSVTQMITSVIMNSRYVYSVFDEARRNPTGEVYWFKVDVQIQLKKFDACRGEFAKHIIYRVVPFKVHSSIFTAAGAVPQGYRQLTKKIVKNYNYIYTGKNQDVLKFDLEFNNMFFTGARPSSENNSRTVVTRGQQNSANEPQEQAQINCDTQQAGLISRTGTAPVGRQLGPNSSPDPVGASSVQKRVAQQFQDAFLAGQSGDMIKANMEILGDPYYLVDSGISNYFAKEYKDGVNSDGTMTYDGSDVYIYVTFRTPTDALPDKGTFNFPNGQSVSPFSGIFKIIKVHSTFKGGIFQQELELARMQKQPSDFEGVGGEVRPDAVTFPLIPNGRLEPPTQQQGGGNITIGGGGVTSRQSAANAGFGESAFGEFGPPVTPPNSGAGDGAEAERIASIQQARRNGANVGF